MPARRPYASRGVPRRVATRRPGDARRLGLAALLVVAGGIALASVWLSDPFGRAWQPVGATSDVTLPPNAVAQADLQMADVAVPTPRSASPDRATTLRNWNVGATDIVADPALIARLDQALTGTDGQVSLVVKNLASGHGAVLDGTHELPAASLYKLPVLYAVFDAGLSLAEPLPITEEARAYDSGTLELGVGETLTVAEALERMITISDNTSAVMLGSRVGSQRINATLRGLGLETTHYSLERMTTSAVDMLRLLELMARGQAVSRAASADMVHLLLRQRVNDRLPRGLPDNVQVAHKTGNLPGTVNDVGLVYGASSTVAVVALISDTTDEVAAATAIARAAEAAVTYFEAQPADSRRPTLPPAPVRVVPPVWREPRPVPTPTATVAPTAEPAATSPTPTVTPTPAVPPSAVPPAAVQPTPRAAAPPPTPTVARPSAPAPTATRVATSPPPAPTTRPAVATATVGSGRR